jgi:hypothetical protein
LNLLKIGSAAETTTMLSHVPIEISNMICNEQKHSIYLQWSILDRGRGHEVDTWKAPLLRNVVAFKCCRTPSAHPPVGGSGTGLKSQGTQGGAAAPDEIGSG